MTMVRRKKVLKNARILASVALFLIVVAWYRANITKIEGVSLLVRNFTEQEYLLKLKLSDERGRIVKELAIPVTADDLGYKKNAYGRLSFDQLTSYDLEFKRFAIEVELLSAPAGSVIDRAVLFWPGDAGVAECASCYRIGIEIGIRKIKGRPRLVFTGVL